MDYTRILHRAMAISTQRRFLSIYAFCLAFLDFFVGGFIYIYEIVWAYMFYGKARVKIDLTTLEGWYDFVIAHMSESIALLTVAVILFLLYTFLPPFLVGGMVGSIGRIIEDRPMPVVDSVSLGFKNYLKLLELDVITSIVSLPKIIILVYAMSRFLGPAFSDFLITLLIVFIFLVFMFNILIVYTPYFVVLRGDSIFSGFGKSIRVVIMYWKDVALIFSISIFLILRVVFNILLFLILPALLTFMFSYLAIWLGFWGSLVISIMLGILTFMVVMWVSARFIVFTYTFWTITLYELEEKDKVHQLL